MILKRAIYVSKVNLNSQEVYEMPNNEALRIKLTQDILTMLKDGLSYEKEYSHFDDDGNEYIGKQKYILNILEKTDTYIHGVVDRTINVFVKERDKKTGELVSRPVQDTEDVEFYYDVLHEYIAFMTRWRFKKNIFNDAFAGFLNIGAKKESYSYTFYLESYNEGMSLEDMKEFVRADKDIKELVITYRPANPDEDIIQDVVRASQSELLRASNATERSVIYKGRGRNGIDGGSEIIQNDIDALSKMNPELSLAEITKRGYAAIRSINNKGEVKSTTDTKAFVRMIEATEDFIEEAKKIIPQILRR